MIVKSAVKSQAKRKALFRGSFLAGMGMLIMIAGSVFLSRHQLSLYGIPLFIAAITLVTIGMIPYRKLTRLENKPDEIHINQDHSWVYYRKGKQILEIPQGTIESMRYISQDQYGICLSLKKNPENKVKVYQPGLRMSHFGCDLFFPYFSERAFKQLADIE